MSRTSVTREEGEAARNAALAVPGVAGLHGGHFGEVALLLPGTRIEGLRASRRADLPQARGLEVNIIFDVSSARNVHEVAADVRSAIQQVTAFDFIDVVVADAA